MNQLAGPDPVEIADRLWWVGHHLPSDRFQCHAYLLEHGDQSVLFDPGSRLTFEQTRRKIERVLPFSSIRYFVCHHQDPDIAGALLDVDAMVQRNDAVLVTHWRAAALLKHLGLGRLPMWLVDEHEWQLTLRPQADSSNEQDERLLRFIFTPYLHFPGAFVSFDSRTGTLLSSDLFGGFTQGSELYANDMRVYEGIRAFHEHYMPSREILLHTLTHLEHLPIRQIAPQHGQILPEPLVGPITANLKELECGLYLMSRRTSSVSRLLQLSTTLRDMLRALQLERDFRTQCHQLLGLARSVLPATFLEFIVKQDDRFIHLAPSNRYRGEEADVPAAVQTLFGVSDIDWSGKIPYVVLQQGLRTGDVGPCLALPLVTAVSHKLDALALIGLEEDFAVDDATERVLRGVAGPLAVAVEREMLLRSLQAERDATHALAIRDPLTGLYTRYHLNELAPRMVALHDRFRHAAFALLVLDVDHFKRVNDEYGHLVGDRALKAVAGEVSRATRAPDVPVRFGGEEILVLANVADLDGACQMAERLRAGVEALAIVADGVQFKITVSIGVAMHRAGESFEELLRRADAALYGAKAQGRNRVQTDAA